MSRKIIVTCQDCGVVLKRHERKSHSKLYCPAKGAPARQERKCGQRSCSTMFVPKQGNPQQVYCSKRCWTRETNAKRLERWQGRKPVVANAQYEADAAALAAKEEAAMAPVRLREEELMAMAAQYTPIMGDALYETTMRLMRKA